MKLSLLFLLFTWANVTIAQDIRIISDFESASIGSLKQVAPNEFKGQTMHWIKYDQIGNQYYWFYFKVINVKNKIASFELDNLKGVYRGGPHICFTDYTQPVISYDNESWARIEDVSYDEDKKIFRFSTYFEHDTAWIAYAHPYPYSRYMNYLESVKSSPYLNIIEEGRTPENRSIPLLEITNPGKKKDKKSILISAMQHSGEDAGGYSAEGIINFLLSDNIEAQKIRDEYVYYIVPVMNPDGVFHGVSRYTPKMQDLNDEWVREDTDEMDSPMEVEFLKNWIIDRYKNNNSIDLFIDIHCHLQRNLNIAFLDRSKETEALKELTELMRNYWPHVRYGHRYSPARLAVNFTAELNIPSLVVEFTQAYESDGDGNYLTIDDYRQFGEDMVKSITSFLNE
ncbi:MAG: M14-type cytosolic carboxypeptidase [bacterium]